MDRQEFELRYPKLYGLLREISLDNGMNFREQIFGNGVYPHDLELEDLEEQASILSEEEALMMAVGEQSEVEELATRKDLARLNRFLNDVFDGDLSPQVWD